MDDKSKKAKVLVVDDEPANIQILMELLKDKYAVVPATNGEAALQIATEEPIPDIIILDIMMPEMDGYEVCERLILDDKTKDIPIIFVTAKVEEEDEQKGLKLGAVDYITKPISPAIVKARISTQMELKEHRDHLEELVSERTEQLKRAFQKLESYSLDSIYRLTRAAEYKDEDTGAHIQRMSHYSAAVARQMGLNENVTKRILYAAPLHDVGKLGIPDRILLKPGKLDPDEWKIMQQHATFGGSILEGAKAGYLKLGEVIALTHHEKWDGSGYPNGLKGKEIPKVGQIVAIADVFDALTTKRPYKEPFSLEKSYAIIEEGRGNHFDPTVVDAFFAVEDEILSIKEKYKDEDQSLFLKIAQRSQ